ncbi:hypothetical protein HNQ80_001187 [Anaerosolibacter carboniphilus]|uniref:Uncharacterized protein n=1 Tax=Anaerosolibacter carboniphilus TaxID=1417629 RepID=A0A841KSH7_9FIRM|nr:hypothetical protein [Anaerosolibacter carboniphilus]MBB6215098.1 hypothetical protein [Anaerosolibacter carboniphilus]
MLYKINRRTIITWFLLILILLLVAGCAQKVDNQNKKTDTTVSENSEKSVDNTSNTNNKQESKEASKEVEKTIETFEPLKFVNTPLPFDLEPHRTITPLGNEIRNAGPSRIGTFYGDGFRFQIIGFQNNVTTIKFANIGSETITLTDESIKYIVYSNGGENISGTKLTGAPISIEPNQTKDLQVSFTDPRTVYLRFNIKDTITEIRIRSSLQDKPISDVTPLVSDRSNMTDGGITPEGKEGPVPVTYASLEIVGNGYTKFQVLGIQYTGNDTIGKLSKPEKGMLALAKVRLANTSNEEISINQVVIRSISGKGITVEETLSKEDMQKALGDKGLPTSIKPQSIVEGFVPFVFNDSLEVTMIGIETNKGSMAIRHLDSFPPLQ